MRRVVLGGAAYLPRSRYSSSAVLRQPSVSANGKPLHGAAKIKRDAC
jgi:hypothetical protein